MRDFWPEIKLIVRGGIPKLVLMAEFSAETDQEAAALTTAVKKEIAQYELPSRITRNQAEAEKFWTIRRESFKLLRENVHRKHTVPLIDDFVVRAEFFREFLPKLYSILDEYKLIYTVAGHVCNGNFHVIPVMDFHALTLQTLSKSYLTGCAH